MGQGTLLKNINCTFRIESELKYCQVKVYPDLKEMDQAGSSLLSQKRVKT
jgi:hypothetical protein